MCVRRGVKASLGSQGRRLGRCQVAVNRFNHVSTTYLLFMEDGHLINSDSLAIPALGALNCANISIGASNNP